MLSMKRFICLMMFFACLIFLYFSPNVAQLFDIFPKSSKGGHVVSDKIRNRMERAMQFFEINQRNETNFTAVFYNTEIKGFYEWTDWRRMDLGKDYHRPGDYGNLYKKVDHIFFVNQNFGFNTYLNNKIPVDRVLSDLRPKQCSYWHYWPKALPRVSIIIAFADEDDNVFLRTMHSVILNTPRSLLQEFIFVIDNPSFDFEFFRNEFYETMKSFKLDSNDKTLLKKFSNYSQQMPLLIGEKFDQNKIRWLVTQEKSGLGKCLNMAADIATGDVLVFLKSHVEVAHNWLPPLLATILDNPRTIAIPTFVDIDPVSFFYDDTEPENVELEMPFWNRGLFVEKHSVQLQSFNETQKNHMQTLPYEIDMLSSTQFAVSKRFFRDINLFDPNYLILNEFNLDLSIKLLTVHGRMVKVPCSNVFILRKEISDQVFQVPDQVYIENEYKFEPKCVLKSIAQQIFSPTDLAQFFVFHPALSDDTICANSTNHFGDKYIGQALQIITKENRNMHFEERPFTISPGPLIPIIRSHYSFVPDIPAPNNYTGQIMNEHYAICVHVESGALPDANLTVEVAYCRENRPLSVFRLDADGVLRIEKYCLYPNESIEKNVYSLLAIDCFFRQSTRSGQWRFTSNGELRFFADHCLTFGDSLGILLTHCRSSSSSPVAIDLSQRWKWIY